MSTCLTQITSIPAYTDPTSSEATYIHGNSQGAGVTVYVMDSGVDVESEEFEGRASYGYNLKMLSHRIDHFV